MIVEAVLDAASAPYDVRQNQGKSLIYSYVNLGVDLRMKIYTYCLNNGILCKQSM